MASLVPNPRSDARANLLPHPHTSTLTPRSSKPHPHTPHPHPTRPTRTHPPQLRGGVRWHGGICLVQPHRRKRNASPHPEGIDHNIVPLVLKKDGKLVAEDVGSSWAYIDQETDGGAWILVGNNCQNGAFNVNHLNAEPPLSPLNGGLRGGGGGGGCPNRLNPHHTCNKFCLQKWGDATRQQPRQRPGEDAHPLGKMFAVDVPEADMFANQLTGGFTVTLKKKDGGLGLLLRSRRPSKKHKQLADDREVVFVKTVKAGGSADHSGKIEVNDVITHVNGKAVINNSLSDVRDMVRGGAKRHGGKNGGRRGRGRGWGIKWSGCGGEGVGTWARGRGAGGVQG